MVLRTLLKIGLETITGDENNGERVFDKRFDAARNYALLGTKSRDWQYLYVEDVNKLNFYIKGETSNEEHVFMEIHDYSEEQEFLYLRLYYLDFYVPLIENAILDPKILDILRNHLKNLRQKLWLSICQRKNNLLLVTVS